jgi:hypothetical protein
MMQWKHVIKAQSIVEGYRLLHVVKPSYHRLHARKVFRCYHFSCAEGYWMALRSRGEGILCDPHRTEVKQLRE